MAPNSLPGTVELGRSSGGRSSGVGRSSGLKLNLEKVFQSATKIQVPFSVTFGRSSSVAAAT
eukprot:3691269-Rhodomonas_salina.3